MIYSFSNSLLLFCTFFSYFFHFGTLEHKYFDSQKFTQKFLDDYFDYQLDKVISEVKVPLNQMEMEMKNNEDSEDFGNFDY